MNEAELAAAWKASIKTRQINRAKRKDLRERGLLPKRVIKENATDLEVKRARRQFKRKMKKRIETRKKRKPLTCSDLCDKTHEFQGCPSGTCALRKKGRIRISRPDGDYVKDYITDDFQRESTGRLSHLPEPL